MKLGIITHVEHKKKNGKLFAYEPYIREINLWTKHASEIVVVGTESKSEISPIDSPYDKNISFVRIKGFDVTNIANIVKTIITLPRVLFEIYKVMKKVDHIHIRCPGNVGLLGCVVQILFPKKKKTAKYAGNWDPMSKQPFSYKLQKKILSSTFLTKNCKVLVYGRWENQSKNIIPFFTASYNQREIISLKELDFKGKIKFVYVGAFSKGKQPLKSVKIIEKLKKSGYDVELNMYGEGIEFFKVKEYVKINNLDNDIYLHGNQSKNEVKKCFQKSHFLIFISKSEGWPKVVAESMFWSCLPISTGVSCVPFMLEHGKRGGLVPDDVHTISEFIDKTYLKNYVFYKNSVIKAKNWSQAYTLEKFDKSIEEVLK